MLSIIIISYNSFNTISNCLDKLIRSGLYPVVIVDNASQDNSGRKLKTKYPNAKVISLEQNIGYGGAANRALEGIKTEYSLLLNPDIKASVQSIQALTESANSIMDFTILSPAVEKKDFQKIGLIDQNWVIGAMMLLNMKNLKKVGYFDERFFLFFEETDLCYRVIKNGGRILLNTDIYVEHLAGQSSTPDKNIDRLKHWHYGWSELYFNDKHGLNIGKKNSLRVVLTCLRKYLLTLSVSKKASYKARFLGGLSYLRGLPSNKRLE